MHNTRQVNNFSYPGQQYSMVLITFVSQLIPPIMYPVVILLLVILLYYTLRYWAYRRQQRKKAKEYAYYFKKLDDRYQKLVEERITMDILKNDTLDIQRKELIETCVNQLSPFIESIFYKMQHSYVVPLSINYESQYFPNVMAIVENYYQGQTRRTLFQDKNQPRKEIDQAVRNAVAADIDNRLMRMQSLNYS